MEKYRYFICGLTISFPWKLTRFPESSNVPDARITLGHAAPPPKDRIKFKGPYCQAAANHVFFHVEDIARFSVHDGNNITVEICGNQNLEALNVFLLSSCLGVLLIQRNLLVLHAAALEKNGHVVAFSGGPGTVKSTLSGLLLKSGAKLMTDNITAIDPKGEAGATAFPAFPSIHLWHSAMEKLGLSNDSSWKLRPGLNKYAVSFKQQFIARPLPLHGLCILAPWNKNDLCCREIQGFERITHLSHASFRLKITRGMEMDRQHFQHISALSRAIDIVKLSYPHDWNLNDQLVDLIDTLLFNSATPRQPVITKMRGSNRFLHPS